MAFKDRLKEFSRFIKEQGSLLALFISILALGFGIYNSYLILNKVSSGSEAQTYKQVTSKVIDGIIKSGAPILGDPNAKVTMVEFADFQCPYCKAFFYNTFPQIKSKYIDTGKVKFIYLNFAFLGPESLTAAQASLCALEQNKYWEYHDALFSKQTAENKGDFTVQNLEKIAQNLGLDSNTFNQCLESNKYKDNVGNQTAFGRDYGITGTPGFFVDTQLIKGSLPIDQFESVIDKELSS